MNYSTLALIMNSQVHTVGVKFYRDRGDSMSPKTYVYKTTFDHYIDQHVVVTVSGLPTAVKVVELDPPADDPSITYKWIVDTVNTSKHEENLDVERELIDKVRKVADANKRKQVLDVLGITEDSLKAICFK